MLYVIILLQMERRHEPDRFIEAVIEPIYLDPETLEANPMRRLSPEDWHVGGQLLFDHAKQNGLPISCAFVDADSLKDLNDSRGHEAGDDFLRAIDSAIRHSDLVGYGARVGGDEWKILSVIDEAGALILKGRIKQNVDIFIQKADSEYFKGIDIGVSVGIATSKPEEQISLSELLRRADEDMYREKRALDIETNLRKRMGIKVADMALRFAGITPSKYSKIKRSIG